MKFKWNWNLLNLHQLRLIHLNYLKEQQASPKLKLTHAISVNTMKTSIQVSPKTRSTFIYVIQIKPNGTKTDSKTIYIYHIIKLDPINNHHTIKLDPVNNHQRTCLSKLKNGTKIETRFTCARLMIICRNLGWIAACCLSLLASGLLNVLKARVPNFIRGRTIAVLLNLYDHQVFDVLPLITTNNWNCLMNRFLDRQGA